MEYMLCKDGDFIYYVHYESLMPSSVFPITDNIVNCVQLMTDCLKEKLGNV